MCIVIEGVTPSVHDVSDPIISLYRGTGGVPIRADRNPAIDALSAVVANTYLDRRRGHAFHADPQARRGALVH